MGFGVNRTAWFGRLRFSAGACAFADGDECCGGYWPTTPRLAWWSAHGLPAHVPSCMHALAVRTPVPGLTVGWRTDWLEETGVLTGSGRPSNAREGGVWGIGRVSSTLHRPQAVVLCLTPAVTHR